MMIFHMFKKLEERFSRDMEGLKRDTNSTTRDENYSV